MLFYVGAEEDSANEMSGVAVRDVANSTSVRCCVGLGNSGDACPSFPGLAGSYVPATLDRICG